MEQVSPQALSKNDKFEFILAYTLRNENVSVSSFSTNYVIDTDGTIYQLKKPNNRSATVTVVGGRSSFVNTKIPVAGNFYITPNQKLTLRNTMHFLSKNSKAEITSNDEKLWEMLDGQYYNSRG
jgi:hypothetical protein